MSSLNKKISKNKTKRLLVENELNKIKDFDFGYFIGKSHFEDGVQNYLVFHPMHKYFKSDNSYHISYGHRKDCLMKVLRHLLQLITFLLLH